MQNDTCYRLRQSSVKTLLGQGVCMEKFHGQKPEYEMKYFFCKCLRYATGLMH